MAFMEMYFKIRAFSGSLSQKISQPLAYGMCLTLIIHFIARYTVKNELNRLDSHVVN